MNLAVDCALALAALLGHGAIWIFLYNRAHALALPHKFVSLLEKVILALIVLIPAAFAVQFYQHGFAMVRPAFQNGKLWMPLLYLAPCWLAALAVLPQWLLRRRIARRPAMFLSNDTRSVDVIGELGGRPLGNFVGRVFAAIPRNELFRLEVQEKTFRLPRLPQALDGLTIAHLSDLHYTGHIERAYFDLLIRETNALQADLIAITGDIVDKSPCIDWIAHTLGKLTAPAGCFYVLGNHDKRLRDLDRLRDELNASGLTHLGGRCLQIEIKGCPILLAGNELPWFGPLPDLRDYPPHENGPLRILLSHSPDQFRWAQRQAFDLMLAGHTHGGQIRLPGWGPLVAPSLYGMTYASGVFHQPPTLMHVTRGISGLQPIRWNCPPELTKLVLRCETA